MRIHEEYAVINVPRLLTSRMIFSTTSLRFHPCSTSLRFSPLQLTPHLDCFSPSYPRHASNRLPEDKEGCSWSIAVVSTANTSQEPKWRTRKRLYPVHSQYQWDVNAAGQDLPQPSVQLGQHDLQQYTTEHLLRG